MGSGGVAKKLHYMSAVSTVAMATRYMTAEANGGDVVLPYGVFIVHKLGNRRQIQSLFYRTPKLRLELLHARGDFNIKRSMGIHEVKPPSNVLLLNTSSFFFCHLSTQV